jgi:hypothetical protein
MVGVVRRGVMFAGEYRIRCLSRQEQVVSGESRGVRRPALVARRVQVRAIPVYGGVTMSWVDSVKRSLAGLDRGWRRFALALIVALVWVAAPAAALGQTTSIGFATPAGGGLGTLEGSYGRSGIATIEAPAERGVIVPASSSGRPATAIGDPLSPVRGVTVPTPSAPPADPASFAGPEGTRLTMGQPAVFTASLPQDASVSARTLTWTLTGPAVTGGQATTTCIGADSQLVTSFARPAPSVSRSP